jgi:hypothetical protein
MYTHTRKYYTIQMRDERRDSEPGFDIQQEHGQLLDALIGALGWLLVCACCRTRNPSEPTHPIRAFCFSSSKAFHRVRLLEVRRRAREVLAVHEANGIKPTYERETRHPATATGCGLLALQPGRTLIGPISDKGKLIRCSVRTRRSIRDGESYTVSCS